MVSGVNIYYSHFANGQPVANGLPPHLINTQDNWQDIYASGLVNHLHLNPDAFLSAIPDSLKDKINVKAIEDYNPNPGSENWYVIDTSYNINVALSADGFFRNIPQAVLSLLKQGNLKMIIWHAHECPYQHNPFNKRVKPLWYLELLAERIKEVEIPVNSVCIVTSNMHVKNQQLLFSALKPYNVIGYNYFRHNYYKYINTHYVHGQDADGIGEAESIEAKRSRKFICLNATPVHHRTFLAAELFRRKLNGNGYISFINRRNNDKFGWDEGIFSGTPWQHHAEQNKGGYRGFFSALPIQLDADAGAISGNDRQLPKKYILDSYFSIITESVMSDVPPDNPLFITEKTYKPLYYMHPFILAGCKGTLAYLREIGFETFPEMFDESYDNEADVRKRMMMILDEVERVSNMSHEQLTEIYRTLLPKLKHNRNLMLNASGVEKDFENLLALVHGK